MKITRDGDRVFITDPRRGYGLDVKTITKVVVEDMRGVYGTSEDDVFLQIWTVGASTPLNMTVPTADARQMFQDTPWVLALPRKS